MTININQFASEINKSLAAYANGVGEELEAQAKKAAREAAKKLRETSPVQKVKGGGAYAKGWRAKKVGDAWVVHNATDYQLTHLLEKGHAKSNGGRVPGIVHIEPVAQQTVNDYVKAVEEAIRR